MSFIDSEDKITFFEYDFENRLTNVTYPSGKFSRYTYDGVGNRLTKVNNSEYLIYYYDEENRLLSAGLTTYNYDKKGNLVTKFDFNGKTSYEYDFENRLKKITLPNTSQIFYYYSAIGNRLCKSNYFETTYYLYDRDI